MNETRILVSTLESFFLGKNVRRSIHGMCQMMSTMVLNRKPSLFSAPGRPGALDSQAGSKDSIDTQDITVMDTKLKILEILQVDVVEQLCAVSAGKI